MPVKHATDYIMNTHNFSIEGRVCAIAQSHTSLLEHDGTYDTATDNGLIATLIIEKEIQIMMAHFRCSLSYLPHEVEPKLIIS